MLKFIRSLILIVSSGAAAFGAVRAKNVVLFLGDAGGIPTLNAAGIYGHGRPQSLFIQSLPHFALSDTSSANSWVTDSAAGMTAIMTGVKTNNGMISQAPAAAGEENGKALKTILEYAEEQGLSTGVVTNMEVWDATPGSCYAHFRTRKGVGPIAAQLFNPRFGDGVDVIIGADRQGVEKALVPMNLNLEESLKKSGYVSLMRPEEISANAKRVAAIYDGGDFDPLPVVQKVMQILARNPRGYFLMVEWDMHTKNLKQGLDRALVMDALIKQTASQVGDDTLIIYAADHSYDVRLRSGTKGQPLVIEMPEGKPAELKVLAKPPIRVDDSHTGEEILVAGKGPGADQLHGFIPNTRIFQVMMNAYGWREVGSN